MKKIIIFYICVMGQAGFAMENQGPKPNAYTEKVLSMIRNENRESPTSLYRIAQKKYLEENYDFLIFFMENNNSFSEQYQYMINHLNKNEPLYVALGHNETKIILKLVQYLDYNKTNSYEGPVTINYNGSLNKRLFTIIDQRGSYEDFAVSLYAVVEHIAKLLWQNAAASLPNIATDDQAHEVGKKEEKCLIS